MNASGSAARTLSRMGVVGAIVLLLWPLMATAAAATELDPTFAGDGLRFTRFAGSAAATALALQGDGAVVVAGVREANDRDFAVARYLPNGDLDASFGGDGKVTISFGGLAEAFDVAVQPDGKLVLVGRGGGGFAVARLRPNGELDETFAGDGRRVITLGSSSAARAVALTATGEILIGGAVERAAGGSAFGLLRLRSNGLIDRNFGGGDGVVITRFARRSSFLRGLTVGSGGEIVAAGQVEDIDRGSLFAVAKYQSDGAPDDTFGADGRVVTPVFFDAAANDVELKADGKVVAGGGTFFLDLERLEFAVVRYTASGALDDTFGGDGKVTTAFGGFDSEARIDEIELVGDKVVAVGPSFFADDAFQTARYLSDGSLDPTYGNAGRFRVRLPNAAEGTGLGVTGDGKYVVAGTLFGTMANRFAIARLTP